MKIDIHNYEAYAMDYIDGNLNDSESKEMQAFLLKHPHIAMELEDLNVFELNFDNKSKLDSQFKSDLKKRAIVSSQGIDESNFEEKFIAYFEKDLTKDEREDVLSFVQKNPSLHKEFESYGSLQLTADLSLIYPDKKELKKEESKKLILFYQIVAAAAVLIFGFWFLQTNQETLKRTQFENIQSQKMAQISIPQEHTSLPEKWVPYSVQTPIDLEEISASRTLDFVIMENRKGNIQIENNQWKSEMLLMQGFAFERNHLDSKVDLAAFPDNRNRSAWNLISSALWKTTKAQVKSIGNDIVGEDLRLLGAQNLEQLSGGFISVKKPIVEKE